MSVQGAVADAQLGLGLRVAARPLRLSRDLRSIPVGKYRLPKDGQKWKGVARERMGLAEWLATHGDADGGRIFPSAETMSHHFGWSRRKTFYLLADLRELGLLVSEGLTSEHGTRKRRMNLAAFGHSGVQDSGAGVQTYSAHDRHLTDQIQRVRVEQSSVSSLSQKTKKPMIALPSRTVSEKREKAKQILVAAGHEADLVEIILRRIEVLRFVVGSSPRTPSYFVCAARNALEDTEELRMCRVIVAERRRTGVSMDAPLRVDECSDASKVRFLHAAVEVAAEQGRRSAEVIEERMAAAGVRTR